MLRAISTATILEHNAMTDMTLEKVRDWHRREAAAVNGCGAWQSHTNMADAIDDALKAQGEPVRWMATCMGPIYACEVFRTRKEAEECGDAWDHCHVTPLYAAPPADAALKAQGEPVATVRRSESGSYWIDWHSKQLPDYLGCNLYTAPPTADRPTWEEVREMLAIAARPCATSTFNEKQIADRIIAEFRKRPA
jgi:hypothetical protein